MYPLFPYPSPVRSGDAVAVGDDVVAVEVVAAEQLLAEGEDGGGGVGRDDRIAVVEHHHPIADAADEVGGVRHEDDRAAVSLEAPHRSEEHTSELQSLMRISYAVFCLKKKTKQ